MSRFFIALWLLAAWLAQQARAQHAGDVLMGRNGASQLVATNLPGDTLRLPFVSSGINIGWASTSLGFDRIVTAAPGADLYPMDGVGMIDLEVLQIDPGLSFRSFTAFNTVIADAPGETLRMGPANVLHYHPIVFIDANAVGQEFQGTRSASVRFVDASGTQTPSPAYTLTFAPPAAVTRTYALHLLDIHDARNSSAEAISDTGMVCGGWYHTDPAQQRGVRHSAAGLQELIPPAPGYSDLRMAGINRHGDTVGTLGTDGFLRQGGAITILTPAGASQCQPRAVNEAGQTVGRATISGASTAWSRDAAGAFILLPGLPGYTGHVATGLNNAGRIIGYSTRPAAGGTGADTAAWLSSSGTVQAIAFAGITEMQPLAINDAGDILVSYRRAASGNTLRHAIRNGTVWSELHLTPLPGMSDYRIRGMNNCGEIAGTCVDGDGRYHGFRGRPAWLPQITSEQTDLAISYTGGQLKLAVDEDETPASYTPESVTIYGGPSARQLIPANPAFSFLGVAGSSVWILPQGQEPGLPFLGVTSHVSSGIFTSNCVNMDLESVKGPGHFMVYLVSGFGRPAVHVNSSDGITSADRITANFGSHAHYAWAFSAPGTWQITFRLRATPAGGGAETVSSPQTITFYMEAGRVFPASISPPVISPAGYQFIVSGEVGRECVIRTSADLMNWETVSTFLTTTPESAITQPMTGTRRFYQAIIR
jgi:surface-anchored protein